jgi:hypothetical protein
MVEERRVITTRRPEAITGQTSTADIAELEAAAQIVVQSLSYRAIRNDRKTAGEADLHSSGERKFEKEENKK